jgi:UDP-N-acetylmuramyl pentapeptide synthase
LPRGRLGLHADNHQDALSILRRELRGDDVVMVKGSNTSRMGLVVDGLIDMLSETRHQKEAR